MIKDDERYLNYLLISKHIKKYKNGFKVCKGKEIPFYKTSLCGFRNENVHTITTGDGDGTVKMEYTFRAWIDLRTYINTVDVGVEFNYKILNNQFIFLDDKTVRTYLNLFVQMGIIKKNDEYYTKVVDIIIPSNVSSSSIRKYIKSVSFQRQIKILRLKQKMKGEVYG